MTLWLQHLMKRNDISPLQITLTQDDEELRRDVQKSKRRSSRRIQQMQEFNRSLLEGEPPKKKMATITVSESEEDDADDGDEDEVGSNEGDSGNEDGDYQVDSEEEEEDDEDGEGSGEDEDMDDDEDSVDDDDEDSIMDDDSDVELTKKSLNVKKKRKVKEAVKDG